MPKMGGGGKLGGLGALGSMMGEGGGATGAITGILKENEALKGKQRTPDAIGKAAIEGFAPETKPLIDTVQKLDPTGGKLNDMANKAIKPFQDAVGQTQLDDAIGSFTSGLGI